MPSGVPPTRTFTVYVCWGCVKEDESFAASADLTPFTCSAHGPVESVEVAPVEENAELRLAQALRLIRDSTSGYAANVADRALREAGVPDPDESAADWLERDKGD